VKPFHLAFALLLVIPTIPLMVPGASACTPGVHVAGPDALVSVCVRWLPPQACIGGVPLDVTVSGRMLTDGWVDFCSLWLDVLP
jgi:hypothetical protein